MSKKRRIPICMKCEFLYPVELIPDYEREIYVCPCCGYIISFRQWLFGDD